MASNTRFKGSKHPDVSGLIIRKRNRADTAISSVPGKLPGRSSPQRQKREPSVEVTSARVLPPEEVETESDMEDMEAKDENSEDDDFEDEEYEKEETVFQGLASQELGSSPTPNAQVSTPDNETSESLQTPGFTWNYEVWIGTCKIRSWGGEVDENATLRIVDSVRDAAAEMTQWLQKGTAKYAAVLDTVGSIEAVLTAKPSRPPFKHSIKTISDWWSVEKQMKNWFDASARDFFIQIKHKCDGITLAEMKSQGKDVSIPRPQPCRELPSTSRWEFACVRNPDYRTMGQPPLGHSIETNSQDILELIRAEIGGKVKRVSWIYMYLQGCRINRG
jgi:hypothetical protein